jgi:hypothetical protein
MFALSDHGDEARCRRFLQPSACVSRYIAHPGVDALLKTKAQPQFDRAVSDRSKFSFYVFQQSNPAQFPLVFLVLTVRSAEGCDFSFG